MTQVECVGGLPDFGGLAAGGGGADEGLEEGELVGVVVGHALGVPVDGQGEGMVGLGRGLEGLTY